MRKSKFTDSQIMDAVKRVEAGFGEPDLFHPIKQKYEIPHQHCRRRPD